MLHPPAEVSATAEKAGSHAEGKKQGNEHFIRGVPVLASSDIAASTPSFEGMLCVNTARLFRDATTAADTAGDGAEPGRARAEAAEHVCAFVKTKCAPTSGLFNYLAIPYCYFPLVP